MDRDPSRMYTVTLFNGTFAKVSGHVLLALEKIIKDLEALERRVSENTRSERIGLSTAFVEQWLSSYRPTMVYMYHDDVGKMKWTFSCCGITCTSAMPEVAMRGVFQGIVTRAEDERE